MSTPLLLGIDLGTTNAKAVVYDLTGSPHASSAVGYPTYFLRSGWAEQHPGDWTKALTTAMHRVIAMLGSRIYDLAGIGLSAHGPGLLLVDEQGQPLLDGCPTWQDERCTAQGRRLQDQLGTIWPGMGSSLHNFPAKLLWAIEHHPDVAARASFALGVKDYLIWWLTGRVATEPSSGPGAAQWYAPVFDALNWSIDRLPPVLPSTGVVGHLRRSLVTELGLPVELPIVIGLNDGASASLATGTIHAVESVITLSTNGVLRAVLDSALPAEVRVKHALFNWPYVQGLWIGGGQTKAGASALHWFAKVVGGGDQETLFEQLLTEAAQSPPGSHGALFLPYLIGRGSPHSDPTAAGVFTGLTFATERRDLVRAILEGAGFALRDIFVDLQQMGYALRRLRLSGGGARSGLWRGIIADILGQTLIYYDSDSTLGAAIMAAIGLELCSDFSTAVRMMVHPVTQVQPVKSQVDTYNSLYDRFQSTRDTLFPPIVRD